ncbi:hypothetical protein GCM10027614_74930 [Micromonospora vulcania]
MTQLHPVQPEVGERPFGEPDDRAYRHPALAGGRHRPVTDGRVAVVDVVQRHRAQKLTAGRCGDRHRDVVTGGPVGAAAHPQQGGVVVDVAALRVPLGDVRVAQGVAHRRGVRLPPRAQQQVGGGEFDVFHDAGVWHIAPGSAAR